MISKTIRNAREAKGMTTRELAKEASVTQNMIYRYESGKVKPTMEVRARIYKALGINSKAISKEQIEEATTDRLFDTTMAKARMLEEEEKKILINVARALLRNNENKELVPNDM